MLSLLSVMSPPPALCNLSVRAWCVENKQFELLEFVFDSVYVDLQCEYISLTFTAGSVSLCGVCSHLVVFGMPAVTVMRVLLFVLHVCVL